MEIGIFKLSKQSLTGVKSCIFNVSALTPFVLSEGDINVQYLTINYYSTSRRVRAELAIIISYSTSRSGIFFFIKINQEINYCLSDLADFTLQE